MIRKIKPILISFIAIVSMIIGISTVKAEETNKYFDYDTRSGGETINANIADSKVNTIIRIGNHVPKEYSFKFGGAGTKVTFHGIDSIKLTASSSVLDNETLEDWNLDGLTAEGRSNYFGANNWVLTWDGTQEVHKDDIWGKYYALYENVGKYGEKSIDVKATVVSYQSLGLGKKGALALREDGPGVHVKEVQWVKVKYDFYEHGTTTPVNVKGYTTYWDVDAYQGIHFVNGNPTLYAPRSVSVLKYTTIDGAPFVYNQNNKTYGDANSDYPSSSHDNRVSVSETFSGTSITRVYSFVRPDKDSTTAAEYKVKKKSNGTILHSSVVPGVIKDYSVNTPAGANGSQVKVGDTIIYKITLTNGFEGPITINTIEDTLSKGLKYQAGHVILGKDERKADPTPTNPTGSFVDTGQTIKWTNLGITLQPGETKNLTYNVTVTDKAVNKVNNSVKVVINNYSYQGTLENPVPTTTNPVKTYASDTPSGKDNSAVKVGDTIKYSIKYTNNKSASQEVTITDTLSKGLDFVSSNLGNPMSKTKNSDGTTTVIWKRTLAAGKSEELTYTAKVNSDAQTINIVSNKAKIKFGTDPEVNLNELKNPVPVKAYAGTSTKDNDGWNHSKVKEGKTIKYKVTLANVKNEQITVSVKDILSKGLTYNKDAAVTVGTLEGTPVVSTDSSSKTTTVNFKVVIPAGKVVTLTYSAKVNSDAVKQVNNKATADYGNGPVLIGTLQNPISTSIIPIPVPNTGSTVAIVSIVIGAALVGYGSYVLINQRKKA